MQGTLPWKLNITTIHRQKRVAFQEIDRKFSVKGKPTTAQKVHTDMTTASPDQQQIQSGTLLLQKKSHLPKRYPKKKRF